MDSVGSMSNTAKFVLGSVICGFLVIASFYPLRQFIPIGFQVFIPPILMDFPFLYLLTQLTPAIIFLTTFIVGVFLLRWLIKS